MSLFVTQCRRLTVAGFASVLLALPLVSGCAGGPSQNELGSLEERRNAVAAAETKAADLSADKARLERELAEKKAALKRAKDNQEAASAALSGGTE